MAHTISLKPIEPYEYGCPSCGLQNAASGWYMPGMRQMGHFTCSACATSYLVDLPTGHGLLHAYCLRLDTGEISPPLPSWFADEMQKGYASRTSTVVELSIEKLRPANSVILLNCLDSFYGHALLKLLNSERYLRNGRDLIVIVPSYMRWLVPDGVAEIWTAQVPLREGYNWLDQLDERFHDECKRFSHVELVVTRSPLEPTEYSIARFTRLSPFPHSEWEKRLEKPCVTFIWREDRYWPQPGSAVYEKIIRRSIRTVTGKRLPRVVQSRSIVHLASCIRSAYSTTEFSVAGIGMNGGLPAWIRDERYASVNYSVERSWCTLYSRSHLVIGVHGSNMLLPSALAGAVISIMPRDRYGNFAQDILLPQEMTPREALLFIRFMPVESSAELLAHVATEILRKAVPLQRELTLG